MQYTVGCDELIGSENIEANQTNAVTMVGTISAPNIGQQWLLRFLQ